MGSGRQPARRKTAERREQELFFTSVQKSKFRPGKPTGSPEIVFVEWSQSESEQLMASGTLGKIHLQLRHLRQLRQQRTQREPDWLLRTRPSPPPSPPAVPGSSSACVAEAMCKRRRPIPAWPSCKQLADGEEIRPILRVGVYEKRRHGHQGK